VEIEVGNFSRKERIPPYSLYGDIDSSFKFGKPDFGVQKLKACPYTDNRCTKGKGDCLEFMVDFKEDFYNPNFVLYDAEKDWNGRVDYLPDGGSPICLPESGQVNIIAIAGCYVSKVNFLLSGGGKEDRRTERVYPFFLYGNTGIFGNGDLFAGEGFELDTEYTVSATFDADPSPTIARRFKFDQICEN
jgi:hypothetical protein